jgi:hypothetical protein
LNKLIVSLLMSLTFLGVTYQSIQALPIKSANDPQKNMYDVAKKYGLTHILPRDSRGMEGCATEPRFANAGLYRGYVAIDMCPLRVDDIWYMQMSFYPASAPHNETKKTTEERYRKSLAIVKDYALTTGLGESKTNVLIAAIRQQIIDLLNGKGEVSPNNNGYMRKNKVRHKDLGFTVFIIASYISPPSLYQGLNNIQINLVPMKIGDRLSIRTTAQR